MPTGNSAGLMIVRAIVSHRINTIAPANADEGIRIR